HPFLADGLADHRKGLLSDFAIRNDKVWVAQIEFVDLRLRYELINFDDAFAVDGDGLKLLWFKLDVLAFCDLVAFDDVATVHFFPGFCVDFPVADTIAGFPIKLVEADLFPLGRRREQRDRTRDERQLKITFPIRARGHELLLTLQGTGILPSVPQSTATENSFPGFRSQLVPEFKRDRLLHYL